MCVRFFNVLPETKRPWRQTPSRKKKAVVFTTVTTDAYQDQLNAGFSKECENTLKYIYIINATFPRLDMWRWTKRTVIGCVTCRWNGLMGGPWSMKAAIYCRTYSRQSGYARLVEEQNDRPNVGMTMEHLTAGRCNHFHIMLKNKSNWFFKCIWMSFKRKMSRFFPPCHQTMQN